MNLLFWIIATQMLNECPGSSALYCPLSTLQDSVYTPLVLPEGCEHHYSCNEGDERRGVAHSVNLSEHIEVIRLATEKQRETGSE